MLDTLSCDALARVALFLEKKSITRMRMTCMDLNVRLRERVMCLKHADRLFNWYYKCVANKVVSSIRARVPLLV